MYVLVLTRRCSYCRNHKYEQIIVQLRMKSLISGCPATTDSIEANVENAEVHVERGTEQLQRANYYQVSTQWACGAYGHYGQF